MIIRTGWLKVIIIVYCKKTSGFFCVGFFVPPQNFSLIRKRHYCQGLQILTYARHSWPLSVPHLLWHAAAVYNDHLWDPVTLRPIVERLAVEFSLLVKYDFCLQRLGFEHPTFHMRGERSNRQRPRYYLSLEKGVVLRLNKMEFPSSKDASCQVWLKLAQWFWRSRWNCEKFTTTLTTTTTDNGQILLVWVSGMKLKFSLSVCLNLWENTQLRFFSQIWLLESNSKISAAPLTFSDTFSFLFHDINCLLTLIKL